MSPISLIWWRSVEVVEVVEVKVVEVVVVVAVVFELLPLVARQCHRSVLLDIDEAITPVQ